MKDRTSSAPAWRPALRRLRFALLAIVALLTAGVAVSVAASGETHGCSLAGSKTVFRSPKVRVFEHYEESDQTRYTYACAFGVEKRYVIGEWDPITTGGDEIEKLRLAYPYIGYERVHVARFPENSDQVCELNVQTGAGGCDGVGPFFDFGVTHAGSLAWMDLPADEPDPCPSGPCVRKLDAGASTPVLLDSGRDIDESSFAVGGTHIYWLKAGVPRSATMP